MSVRFVEGLAPRNKDHFAWDSEVVGFGIKVSMGGHKSYVLQYRHEGRSRRYTIGPHGSPWTPETARTEAKKLLGAAALMLLRSLPQVQGNPYVLPGKSGKGHLVGLQKCWERIRSQPVWMTFVSMTCAIRSPASGPMAATACW